jgi:outer membrane lipoprotein-sorting protein
MRTINLQSAETIDQNGIIYYLTGEYAYVGKIENGNTRIILDENDGMLYMIEMNDLKMNLLTN